MDSFVRDSHLLGLAAEIWLMILKYLRLQDKKQLRLASRGCREKATPSSFKTLTFDVSNDSIANLCRIASKKELASQVRILVLQRRKRMRRFSDRHNWEGGVCLPDDPNISMSSFDSGDGEDNTYDGIMTYHDWLQCNDAERERLYQRYEDDRVAQNDNTQALATHMCFRRMGCTFSEQVNRTTLTGEKSMVRKFEEALARFTGMTTFIHKPTVRLDDRWVTYWNQLRFEPYTFDNGYDEDCQDDNDIEALHVSCTLRAIGWAKRYLTNLNSITFHVEGPAFWGPRRLRRLWQGDGHGEVQKLRLLYDDAMGADVDAEPIPADFSRNDEYVRQLTIMESALDGRTHLDCSVSEDEDSGGLFMAARYLFEFLCRGQDLKRVRLAFGWLVDGSISSDYWSRENGDGPKELLTLLTNYTPWSKIEELKLEIATDQNTLLRFLASLNVTLRHLTLSTVTFAPSHGTWDSALPTIARSLTNLRTLDVAALCDFPQDRKQRLLFNAEAPLWAGKSACYDEYRKRVMGHLLNTKELHQLEPDTFMEEHRQSCKHTFEAPSR
jgi:hypothetical protein